MYTQEMKSELNFWQSLEEYLRKVTQRSPLPWQWVGIGMVVIAIFLSLLNVKNSLVEAKDIRDGVEIAVSRGDYETAKKLYERRTENIEYRILGAGSELEDKVYPERPVERKIAELQEKLDIYPGNREIYLELASLYGQLGNKEIEDEYLEKARVLDPNGVEF